MNGERFMPYRLQAKRNLCQSHLHTDKKMSD